VSCNKLLGQEVENPVATLFAGGYDALINHCKAEGPYLLFTWLSLIFLKTHLKDRSLLINRDRRIASQKISELYEWPELHHIHCIARTAYTGVTLSHEAVGSIFLLPIKTDFRFGDFDYADNYLGRTILLRLGDIGLICVLNDACAAMNLLKDSIQKFTGPLNPIQFRELFALCTYANFALKDRPQFFTVVDADKNLLTIGAQLPEAWESVDFDEEQFGRILYPALFSPLKVLDLPEPDKWYESARQGKLTFLFDENGHFQDGD